MDRTPLLLETPVPVDWPRRVGLPSPGIVRVPAYPAGGPPNPERPKPTVDGVYPRSALNLAKARAWMFPGRRIKVGKRVFREAVDRDCVKAAAVKHGSMDSQSDPEVGFHTFRSREGRHNFIQAARDCGHEVKSKKEGTAKGRRGTENVYTVHVAPKRPQPLDPDDLRAKMRERWASLGMPTAR